MCLQRRRWAIFWRHGWGILRCCSALEFNPQEKPMEIHGRFFTHPEKIWVITYNSPLKFWGGVFFFSGPFWVGKISSCSMEQLLWLSLSLSLSLSFFQGFQVATPWRWDRCLPITMGESIGNHCKIFAKDCNGELVFVFFFFLFFF